MKLNEFCEKFVAHNTVVCLVQETIKKNEEGCLQQEYNEVWRGMDWQIVQGPGDESYFKAHPDVEKCPFKNFEVIKVIGNIFNEFPETPDNITIVIGLRCAYDPMHDVEAVTNKIKDCIHYCENISQDTDDALCEQIDDIVETYKKESKK